MDDLTAFVAAARAWRRLVEEAHRIDASLRAEALASHLVHLYAAALRLPGATAPEALPDPRPWPEAWPGLGPEDDQPPALTMLLQGVTSDLDRGLALIDDAPDNAFRWWRASFDARWGTLATASLPRLHRLLQRDRSDAPAGPPPPRDAPAPQPVPEPEPEPAAGTVTVAGETPLPSLEPARPTRRSLGRDRTGSGGPRGLLGIRVYPAHGGAQVIAVHPGGPARDRLEVGELLVSIDGVPLSGRDTDSLNAALASTPGQPRTLLVARGAGLAEVVLDPVTADDLAQAPLEVPLLVLDRDTADALLAPLLSAGVTRTRHPEQDAVDVLQVPGPLSGAARALLQQGQDAGLWDVLDRVP